MRGRSYPNLTIAAWIAGILFALVGLLLVLEADQYQMIESPITEIIAVMTVFALIGTVLGGLLTKEWVMAFLTCGMLSTPTFVLLRFGYWPAINAAFDDSRARTHEVKIREVHMRKALLTRKITVESWRGNRDGEIIHVPVNLLDKSPTHVVLVLREGALGYDWISSIKAAR